MAQTPASGAAAYCPAAVALDMLPPQLASDLLLDTGGVATPADLANPATDAGRRFALLLQAASGEVESAASRGKKYTADDLAALDGNGQVHLQEIVVSLAVGKALWRRDPTRPPPEALKWARDRLAALEKGEEIFPFAEAEDAGAGMETVLSPGQQPGPRKPLSLDAARYFGRRSYRFPPGPSGAVIPRPSGGGDYFGSYF